MMNENGKLHCEDGPATEWADGGKEWRCHGDLHRLDGPAITWTNGSNFWYNMGKLHRTDGSAIEYVTGPKYWFVNGEEIDIKSIFERLDISPDWKNWTDAEKMIVRLAFP